MWPCALSAAGYKVSLEGGGLLQVQMSHFLPSYFIVLVLFAPWVLDGPNFSLRGGECGNKSSHCNQYFRIFHPYLRMMKL